jgi:hypothetical protein
LYDKTSRLLGCLQPKVNPFVFPIICIRLAPLLGSSTLSVWPTWVTWVTRSHSEKSWRLISIRSRPTWCAWHAPRSPSPWSGTPSRDSCLPTEIRCCYFTKWYSLALRSIMLQQIATDSALNVPNGYNTENTW